MLWDSKGGACILTGREVNVRARQLIRAQPSPVHTITVDNGTEFHADKQLEALATRASMPRTSHHSWELGTNENTNGLNRQYLRSVPAWNASPNRTARALQRNAINGLANA